MSNYLGRKSDFTPSVYTRYFEQRETPKSPNDHIYFGEENEATSTNYQIKRDLIFKRLFPSKYAESNNNKTESEQNHQNRTNNTAQSLGDFIPLSKTISSTLKKESALTLPDTNIVLTSSDEDEEDSFQESKLPTSFHQSIVGHLHSRSTIQNVRTILIRELYQRTSDSNTEWLKCKMELPREYINPKYYADFRRRYRKDIERNTIKKTKSHSIKSKTENGYHVYDSTATEKSTIQIDDSLENEDIVETSSTKPVKNSSSSSPIRLSNDSSKQSKSTPEYITLDTDEDEDINDADANSSYFIDRSSSSFTTPSQPTKVSTEDYHEEDSKYAQLPSRTTSSSSIIRPILSKHQRRKLYIPKDPPKPLVSAIDRIIDHMDQSDTLINPSIIQQQNLLIKQIKKRKKKKKSKVLNSTTN